MSESFNDNFIRQFGQLDSSPEFYDKLSTLLSEESAFGSDLSPQDIQKLANFLDKVRTPFPTVQSRLLKPAQTSVDTPNLYCEGYLGALTRFCLSHRVLPESYAITGTLFITSSHPVASGVVADIWEGMLDGRNVCVKRTRTCWTSPSEDVWLDMVRCPFFPLPTALNGVPKYYREVVLWKHLKHPNIVPFLGITSTPFQFVSEWMSGGNLLQYTKKHPDADRLGLVSSSLPVVVWREIHPFASYSGSLRLSITFIRWALYMEISKGRVNIETCCPNLLTNALAKYLCRRFRACTSRGFWPCHCHSEH